MRKLHKGQHSLGNAKLVKDSICHWRLQFEVQKFKVQNLYTLQHCFLRAITCEPAWRAASSTQHMSELSVTNGGWTQMCGKWGEFPATRTEAWKLYRSNEELDREDDELVCATWNERGRATKWQIGTHLSNVRAHATLSVKVNNANRSSVMVRWNKMLSYRRETALQDAL